MITVEAVAGRAARAAFLRLPGAAMALDPQWVEPLRLERRRFLDPKHNPYFAHAETQFWLARRGGRPVGRISAQIDRLAPREDGAVIGHFGMLAALDAEPVAPLLAAAEDWLRARGAGQARGPFSLSINHTSGVLIDGFDAPPSVMMAHDPRWLGAAVAACGYAKARDLVAYTLDVRHGLSDRLRRHGQRLGPGLRIRSIRMADFDAEIETITAIFNDAWAGNWGFAPLTEAETAALAVDLKPIIDPELVKIGEIDGDPVGFIVLLPNINEALAGLGGRLLPLGWARLLWRLKVRGVRSARVPLMGVRKAAQATMAGKTLPLKLIYALEDRSLARRIETLEMSWLLEDNWPVRHVIESIGGAVSKTWRVYGKAL